MFWRRKLVSDELAAWTVDVFAWLIETLGPEVFFHSIELVRPTRAFFATGDGTDHATAVSVFAEVRAHMRMAGWPCVLVRQDTEIDPLVGRGVLVEHGARDPGGTFCFDGEHAVITYNPELMSAPQAFIGMLAHELAHYLLAPHVEDAPGGAELHEFVTEVTAIFAGFGIFQLEAGFTAQANNEGWLIGNLGYISSEHRAYALALFLRAKGIDPMEAEPYLLVDRWKMLKLGLGMIDRDPRALEQLTALRP